MDVVPTPTRRPVVVRRTAAMAVAAAVLASCGSSSSTEEAAVGEPTTTALARVESGDDSRDLSAGDGADDGAIERRPGRDLGSLGTAPLLAGARPTLTLTADDLASVMLSVADLGPGFDGPFGGPGQPYVTEPAACAEGLDPAGTQDPALSLDAGFDATDVLVSWSHGLDVGSGRTDLAPVRAAIAGPCAAGVLVPSGDGGALLELSALPDPALGDDAVAARIDTSFTVDGVTVAATGVMVVVLRDDVTSVVQVLGADVPELGLDAPEVTLDDVVAVAGAIDERLVRVIG